MLSEKIKKIIVEKLLIQYDIYLLLLEQIRQEKLKQIKLDNRENQSIVKNNIEILNIILNKTSDEMTFPCPSIWIMYKHEAYKTTDKEITSLQDFIEHCSPAGYVCTKRLNFVKKYLDFSNFDLSDNLDKIYNSDILLKLEKDNYFVKVWIENEFRIQNDKISKWEEST